MIVISFSGCIQKKHLANNDNPKGYGKLNESIEIIIQQIEEINLEIYEKHSAQGKGLKFFKLKNDYWNPLTYTRMDSLLNSFDDKGIRFGGEVFQIVYVEFKIMYNQVDKGFARKFRDNRILNHCTISSSARYRKHAYFVRDNIFRSYFIEWGRLVEWGKQDSSLNAQSEWANKGSKMISTISETRINDVAKITCRISLLNKKALARGIKK